MFQFVLYLVLISNVRSLKMYYGIGISCASLEFLKDGNLTTCILSGEMSSSNQNNGSWNLEDSLNNCIVPSLEDLKDNMIDIDISDELPAWINTTALVSDWAHFGGCINISLQNYISSGRLHDFLIGVFPNNSDPTPENDIFSCAFHCTKATDYFVYIEGLCHCVKIMNKNITNSTECLTICSNNFNDIFCISEKGIPVFQFNRGLEGHSKLLVERTDIDVFPQQCLAGNKNKLQVTDCKHDEHKTVCDKEISSYRRTWNDAINFCTNSSSTIPLVSVNKTQSTWLGYFSYFRISNTTSKDRRIKCIAVKSINQIKSSISYTIQLRNCGDNLSAICFKENQTDEPETDIVDNENTSLGVITMYNVVLFVLCVFTALLYLSRMLYRKMTGS